MTFLAAKREQLSQPLNMILANPMNRIIRITEITLVGITGAQIRSRARSFDSRLSLWLSRCLKLLNYKMSTKQKMSFKRTASEKFNVQLNKIIWIFRFFLILNYGTEWKWEVSKTALKLPFRSSYQPVWPPSWKKNFFRLCIDRMAVKVQNGG